jgi:hypothetical protein
MGRIIHPAGCGSVSDLTTMVRRDARRGLSFQLWKALKIAR